MSYTKIIVAAALLIGVYAGLAMLARRMAFFLLRYPAGYWGVQGRAEVVRLQVDGLRLHA